MLEIQIQNILFRDFKKKYQYVLKEAPVFSRSIDLVYINEEQEVVSVEIKLRDWRRAITQAIDHQLVVDRAYICLPNKKRGVSDELLNLLDSTGIGLLFFKKKFGIVKLQEVKPAQKTDFSWWPSREKLEKLLYAY